MSGKTIVSLFLIFSIIFGGLGFARPGGGGGGTPTTPAKFSISGSYADVYGVDASGCAKITNLRWTLAGRAVTTANRAAYYVAADVRLFSGGRERIRPTKLAESYGPKSSINTETVTNSETCFNLTNYAYETEAQGWHKAVPQSNDPNSSGTLYLSTSDKQRW